MNLKSVVFNQGKLQILSDLVVRSNQNCEPFSVSDGKTEVYLINVACFKQQGDQQSGTGNNQ